MIPAPVVRVTNVPRGSISAGASCGDAGTVTLSISLPATSKYKVEQFGVYFRVVEGIPPDEIFSNRPVKGDVAGGRMDLLFPWLDGAPSGQKPLNLKVEAFFVTDSLDVGPSTVFEVKG